MGSGEYQELKAQMDRIEAMLSRLLGAPQTPSGQESVAVSPPQPVTPEMSETERRKALQAEGRWILETQGMDAYKRFWQEQAKKAKPKPKIRRAA